MTHRIRTDLPDSHSLAEYRGMTGSLQDNMSDNPLRRGFDHELFPDEPDDIFFFVNDDDVEEVCTDETGHLTGTDHRSQECPTYHKEV